MLDYKKIDEKIKEYLKNEEQEFDDCFLGGVSLEKISLVEKKLGVQFPTSYKEFLKKYGSGGIDGIIFWGIENNNVDINKNTVLFNTEKYRKKGIPDDLVVFRDVGEYVVCLETKKMDKNAECPVVTWSYHDKDGIIFCEKNFYIYFLKCVEECL